MTGSLAIRVLVTTFAAGLCVGVVGVALMFGNLNPVGGGCTNTSGPIVCTSPHQSVRFVEGAVLSGVGSLIALAGGTGLRWVGWQFPWLRTEAEVRSLPAGTCPSCGVPNPAEGLFCSACGAPLIAHGQADDPAAFSTGTLEPRVGGP